MASFKHVNEQNLKKYQYIKYISTFTYYSLVRISLYLALGSTGLGKTETPDLLRQWIQFESIKQGDKWAETGSSMTIASPAIMFLLAITCRPPDSLYTGINVAIKLHFESIYVDVLQTFYLSKYLLLD